MITNSFAKLLGKSIIATIILCASFAVAMAGPQGVEGTSNPGSTVCARDVNNQLWCTTADANGHFNLIGDKDTYNNFIPLHGVIFIFNKDCPEFGMDVDRDSPQFAGGPWLDVSCKGCVEPPTGLSAWYPLDSEAGKYTGNLMGGPGGKLTGSVAIGTGFVSGGADFNGGYIEFPNSANSNPGVGDFSIDLWVKVTDPKNLVGVRVLVEKREPIIGGYRGYSFLLYQGKLLLQLDDGGYDNYLSNLTVPADGKWHLVGVSVERANPLGGNFYLDGVWGSTFDPTKHNQTLSNNRPLRLGSNTLGVTSGGNFFKGSMDEVEIFFRALPKEDFDKLFTAGSFGKCKPCPECPSTK